MDGRHTETSVVDANKGQRTYLGANKQTWCIYYICGVASIANMFQGFDSGIYTIIIAEPAFVEESEITGAHAGVAWVSRSGLSLI